MQVRQGLLDRLDQPVRPDQQERLARLVSLVLLVLPALTALSMAVPELQGYLVVAGHRAASDCRVTQDLPVPLAVVELPEHLVRLVRRVTTGVVARVEIREPLALRGWPGQAAPAASLGVVGHRGHPVRVERLEFLDLQALREIPGHQARREYQGQVAPLAYLDHPVRLEQPAQAALRG